MPFVFLLLFVVIVSPQIIGYKVSICLASADQFSQVSLHYNAIIGYVG